MEARRVMERGRQREIKRGRDTKKRGRETQAE